MNGKDNDLHWTFLIPEAFLAGTMSSVAMAIEGKIINSVLTKNIKH